MCKVNRPEKKKSGNNERNQREIRVDDERVKPELMIETRNEMQCEAK